MNSMSVTKFDNWKKQKQGVQLCNASDQQNIKIYGSKHMMVHLFYDGYAPFTEPPTASHTCWDEPPNLTYGHWYPKYITFSVKSTKFFLFFISGAVSVPIFGEPPDLWLQDLWSHYKV